MKKLLTIVLLLCLAISCARDEKILPTPQNNEAAVLAYIKSMGYEDSEIQDLPEMFIVQNDIAFSKTMIVPSADEIRNGRTKQRYNNSLIDYVYQNVIKVKIDATMSASPNMTSEITAAISDWNSLGYQGSRLRFQIVTSGYDMIIRKNDSMTPCGLGQYSGNGKSGTWIEINKSILTPLNFTQRKGTIMHELGHTVGLHHTDSSDGIPVPGVEGADALSLMKSCCCNFGGNNTFSTNDILAIKTLYPTEKPYGMFHNGYYPFVFQWSAPLYTGFGSLVQFEVKHTRYDYTGTPIVSAVTYQTGTSYQLPFTQGQYSGQSVIVSVRAQFSSGTYSDWENYNCTL